MSTLISRSAILSFSRASNLAVQMLSPLLLVRLLDVQGYGQYQEFMIYAMMFSTIATFAVDSSLTYFIPRAPEREKEFVSQATLITLALSILCVLVILAARPLAPLVTSHDIVNPLAAYVFFFVAFGWAEHYWIAKRRVDLVLYYTGARLVSRVVALIVVAYVTRDVKQVILATIFVEVIRAFLLGVYFGRQSMFTLRLSAAGIREHMRYAVPLGSSGLVQQIGRDANKLFVAASFGPAALAYYSVGSYVLPVIQATRGAISDVIYPELVRAQGDTSQALRLWRRSNVMYCAVLFPAFVVCLYHADTIVTFLFTNSLAPAVPVFQIYSAFLLRRCFNFDVLLRARGRTGFMLSGSLTALCLNIVLIALLHHAFGLLGPAIAFLVSEILIELHYARRVQQLMGISTAELVDWPEIGRITLATCLSIPILIAGNHLPIGDVPSAFLASTVFAISSLFLAYRFGVADIARVAASVAALLRRPNSRK